MDRSLKWRTIALVAITLFCVGTLAPSFVPRDTLPSWFTSLFNKRINYGLDLQGGLHIVYSIDLNKAVDDRASEIKRDLDIEIGDHPDKYGVAIAKTPYGENIPVGSVTVTAPDAAKKAALQDYIDKNVERDTDVK
jgi:preprotein translocase subunit SecD